MPKWMPTAPEVMREAVIVVAGALLATVFVKYVVPENMKQLFNFSGINGTQPPQNPGFL